MNIAASIELEPDPIEIDPRPCELCGCTIDQHRRIDTPEGPDFFCDDVEREIMLRAADLVRQWEFADSRDRWRHIGERPPPPAIEGPAAKPYRTPQSTIDAFWYVVHLDDADRLEAWLLAHSKDAPTLLKMLETK